MARRRRSFFFDNINKKLLTNTLKNTRDVKDDIDNDTNISSSSMTRSAVESLIDTEIAALANSAPATLNTLDELAAALGDDANFSTTVTTSLSNRLRVDVNNQGLTTTQKSNATTNLGLGTAATTASSDYATSAQGTKADTAHGWGNHASAGYSTTTYGNSDVDSHLNQSNPTSGYVLSWNGSDYAWVEQSGGVTSYNDLTDKPTIPTNNNQLTNGAGYITSAFISDKGSAASLDLNDLTASSDEGYYSWASTQPTNSPGWTYGGVLVLRDDNQNNQIAFGGSTSKMAIRRANSGSYGSWADIWTTNNLTATDKSNYDTAYGWGNHASAGYLTSSSLSDYATLSGSNSFTNSYNEFGNATGSVSNTGSWHGRINVAGTNHAKVEVHAIGDGIIGAMYAHDGHTGPRFGSASNHPVNLMVNGTIVTTFAAPGSGQNNIDIRSGTTGSAGIVLKDSGGTFRSQWYGTGTDNGFLTGEWGAWDLRKTINGQLLLRVSGVDYTAWHDGNDGSGSGLDADTVDGIQGSSIMRLDASGTVPDGVIHTYECYGDIATSSGNQASLQCFNSGSGTDAFMTFHVGGDYAANLGVDGGINDLAYGGWSAGANSYRVYHAGNTPSQTITVAGIGRNAHHTGHLVGSYNSVGANSYKSNPIYTIGSSYNPSDAALGNMYGIGYSHTNATFITGFGGGWGMYVAADGDARIYFGASSGHIYGTGNITAYASDGRLKTNVAPIENAIDKVKKIRGVTFDWVDNITSEYDFHPASMHEHGVIAQEIQEVIPDAVVTAPFNGNYTRKSGTDHNFLTVDKDKIVPLLIEAIKEQQKQIEELKEMINGPSK